MGETVYLMGDQAVQVHPHPRIGRAPFFTAGNGSWQGPVGYPIILVPLKGSFFCLGEGELFVSYLFCQDFWRL